MTEPRTPAQVLREARQKASREKRARVIAVVDQMKASGEPISFLAVARIAGVSNWLVYAEGVREHIEEARKSQAKGESRKAKEGAVASAASVATDFELIRAELRAVRAERDALKAAVQRSLGRQVDQAGSAELVARIRELITQIEVRDETIKALTSERNALKHVLEEAQDDLISSRTALRNMIRGQNAPQDEVH
ncbi:DUF6262 family protein (plasmid) [Embleya sp. NBC_00888]|uniref:DUF6262 family protein n=1 Tax=Embleya sp. NBC_00888 TaxID=2975960 RepID=UPI002F90AE9A|nr:DUF6262 family protein [Embleya sp. NBC_00888]